MNFGYISDKITITVGDDLMPHHRLKNSPITTTYEVIKLRAYP